jgi:hypothetical protein
VTNVLGKGNDPLKSTKRRIKRTAAVIVTGPEKYAKAMTLIRRKINLEDFGITDIRVRKAFNGGIVIEIPGDRADVQANYLATSMRMALEGVEGMEDVRVSVPTQRSGLRLCGIENFTTEEDI